MWIKNITVKKLLLSVKNNIDIRYGFRSDICWIISPDHVFEGNSCVISSFTIYTRTFYVPFCLDKEMEKC